MCSIEQCCCCSYEQFKVIASTTKIFEMNFKWASNWENGKNNKNFATQIRNTIRLYIYYWFHCSVVWRSLYLCIVTISGSKTQSIHYIQNWLVEHQTKTRNHKSRWKIVYIIIMMMMWLWLWLWQQQWRWRWQCLLLISHIVFSAHFLILYMRWPMFRNETKRDSYSHDTGVSTSFDVCAILVKIIKFCVYTQAIVYICLPLFIFLIKWLFTLILCSIFPSFSLFLSRLCFFFFFDAALLLLMLAGKPAIRSIIAFL